MCVATPGKILSVGTDGMAKVSFGGNVINVNVSLIEGKEGDYVLVHAGCALEIMEKSLAEDVLLLFEEINEMDMKE